MNFRSEERSNIPPVRGVLTGKQVRGTCCDQYGTRKMFYASSEVTGIVHFTFPSDDGYKNINIEKAELIEALQLLEVL